MRSRRSLPPVALALLLPVIFATSALGAAPAPDEGARDAFDRAPTVSVDRGLGAPAGPPREGAELDAATESLSTRLRCPVCQGMSVADSPSESARSMKREIEELLAAGYSPGQVQDYFVDAYGEFVLLLPKARGLNLLVWILPAIALLLGGAAIVAAVRSRGRRELEATPDPELELYLDRVRAAAADPPSPRS